MADLFVYGSLMFSEVFEAVVRGTYESEAAGLSGWRRMKIIDEVYPGLVYGDGSVDGVLWKDISLEDLRILDVFEGEYYERIPVYVLGQQGESLQCFVYAVRDRFRHILDSEEWCPSDFEQNGINHFIETYCGFSSC